MNNTLRFDTEYRGNKENEGQLHIKHDNIHSVSDYEFRNDDLEKAIRKAVRRK